MRFGYNTRSNVERGFVPELYRLVMCVVEVQKGPVRCVEDESSVPQNLDDTVSMFYQRHTGQSHRKDHSVGSKRDSREGDARHRAGLGLIPGTSSVASSSFSSDR